MMKRIIFGVSFLLSLMLLTGQGHSQMFHGLKDSPSRAQFERTQKRVEALRMWKLTQSLNLDEETAAKLFPVINKYDRKRLTTEQEMRKNMRKLRRSVNTASEEDLNTLMKNLKSHHLRLQEIQHEEMSRLKDILTTRDMAKFMIFKQDFDREMKRRIFEARERRKKEFREKAFRPSAPPSEQTEKTPPAEKSE
ncbi:MAG: hypothetical protein JSV71_00095 [Nitrospiraceae bacterium]|nr:MAG: hypothetical protein EP227_05470 [bacterium]UCF87147.1 MAG: hypothetical protein JSV71_00095 [Nitrospiraceae bacterium]